MFAVLTLSVLFTSMFAVLTLSVLLTSMFCVCCVNPQCAAIHVYVCCVNPQCAIHVYNAFQPLLCESHKLEDILEYGLNCTHVKIFLPTKTLKRAKKTCFLKSSSDKM